MRLFRLLAVFLALMPAAASAHPHVFVDAGLTLRFDEQGRLGAVEVTWSYDELSTMLMLADLGLDADGDGRLNRVETARLHQLARQWPDGFDGDLYLSLGGGPLALSAPVERWLDYRDGRLIDTHLRAIRSAPDLTNGALSIRMYDPGYYTAYQMAEPPRIVGRQGCEVRVQRADAVAAHRRHAEELALLDALLALGQQTTSTIGAAFADELTLSCATAR